MNKVIKGADLMIFADSKSIALATNHTLTISADTKETSSKDSGGKWQTSEAGVLSWTMKSENLFSAEGNAGVTYQTLFDKMIARTPVELVFSLEGDSTSLDDSKLDAVPTAGWTAKSGFGYTGSAIITNLEANAPNGENATFTVDFTGVGELKKVTASA